MVAAPTPARHGPVGPKQASEVHPRGPWRSRLLPRDRCTWGMPRLSLLLALLALGVGASVAGAYPRVAQPTPAVAGNPVDRLLDVPIEDSVYDPATRCAPRAKPGMLALQRWLEANVR